jgi:hypothetical protein
MILTELMHSSFLYVMSFLSHSSILARRKKPWNCASIKLSMVQTPLLGFMGPIGTGRRRLELATMIKESPEPQLAKRSTSKVGTWILLLARPSLLCGTKGRLVIRPLNPTQRSRMIKTI